MHEAGTRTERRHVRARAERPLRLTAIGCLLGIAVTHLIDVGHKFGEAPAIAALFVALIVGANALALLFLTVKRLDKLWPLAALMAIAPFAGYVASRTIGLPGIEDHVGHWKDPVGTASLLFEAVLLGISLRAARLPVMRLAPAATLIGIGMVAGGWMLGQGEQAHVGHGHGGGGVAHADSGAGHGASAGGHHGGGEAAAGGHSSEHRHEGANIDTATPAQQAEGRRLLVDTTAGVRPYRSYDAARAAGYGFTMKSFEDQKDLDYWHLTHPDYLTDGRDLEPTRPESLMYWNPKDGRKPILMAVVFRVPTAQPNPALAGPIIAWHVHKSRRGGPGKYKMTHMWLLPRMRDAWSMEMPAKRMSKRYGTPADGSGSGL